MRGYLFDLDGTLVDTHDANVAAYSDAIPFVIKGTPIDRVELRRHIANGESCTDFVPIIAKGATSEEVRQVAKRKAEVYPSCLHLSRLNDKLVSQVREWRKSPDVVTVLVTTAKRPNAEAVLARHSIQDLFDYEVFGDGIEHLKPAPDIYIKALSCAGLDAGDCIAFEDSDAGVQAATAAGVSVRKVKEW